MSDYKMVKTCTYIRESRSQKTYFLAPEDHPWDSYWPQLAVITVIQAKMGGFPSFWAIGLDLFITIDSIPWGAVTYAKIIQSGSHNTLCYTYEDPPMGSLLATN